MLRLLLITLQNHPQSAEPQNPAEEDNTATTSKPEEKKWPAREAYATWQEYKQGDFSSNLNDAASLEKVRKAYHFLHGAYGYPTHEVLKAAYLEREGTPARDCTVTTAWVRMLQVPLGIYGIRNIKVNHTDYGEKLREWQREREEEGAGSAHCRRARE
jgi:hypothetical protein